MRVKKLLVIALVAMTGIHVFAEEKTDGRWIAYPGDYGIWWGNRAQARRLKWCNRMTPTWPLYAPYPCVTFSKTVPMLAQPETVEIVADGSYTVGCSTTRVAEPGARLGKFTIPAGTNVTFHVRVYNDARPPSIRVKGHLFASDDTWRASWNRADDVAVETMTGDGDTPPGLVKFPVKPMEPVKAWRDEKGRLFADFGRETYGYLKLRDVRGKGALKIVYAESLAEAMAEEFDTKDDYKTVLDGWELITVDTAGKNELEIRRDYPAGFRYICVRPWEGSDVVVGSIAMDYEWKPVKLRGAFRCDDDELNRIWEVSARTLELTRREVMVEGVKRDHWVWSGDAVQNFLMEYYSAADYAGVKHTLWNLRGKEPVVQHLNGIMDYSWYWFDAVAKYYLYTGDGTFLKQVYPRMRSFLEWGIGRLDANGRPHDRPGDWMFIDWAPGPLHNTGGVTAFEQMLFVRALESTATVAEFVGATDDAEAYRSRAAKLRAEVKPLFWNDEKGCLMHLLKDDGKLDEQVTRYPNMFGLFFGYFKPDEAERVAKNVILNDKVMRIVTPYMRFYELEALCSLGRQSEVMKEMKSYWGDMLRLGATSFWELYDPEQKGEEHYAMYGRDFGRSLCHAWGASPLYLLGRYYLGVEPTKPGYAEYMVKPTLGGLKWMEGRVPTPHGDIEVRVDGEMLTVKGVKGCTGKVVFNGRTHVVRGDETLKVKVGAP